jgi:hypothetical protein
MLNKHTRRRFVWWYAKLREENDPFMSIVKAGLTIHSLQRGETKQKGTKSIPYWRGTESHRAPPFIIRKLGELK